MVRAELGDAAGLDGEGMRRWDVGWEWSCRMHLELVAAMATGRTSCRVRDVCGWIANGHEDDNEQRRCGGWGIGGSVGSMI